MKEKIIKVLMAFLFAVSCGFLSCQLIVLKYYNDFNLIITFLISFLSSLWIYKSTVEENIINLKKNKLFTIICMILSLMVLFKLYDTKALVYKKTLNELLFNPLRLRYFIVSSIGLVYLGCFIGNRIRKFLIDFLRSLSSWDKKAYLLVSIISIILVVVLYSNNSEWFLQYDKVYSIDSGFVFKNIYSTSIYYDIRHPLLNIFAFPMWAVVDTIVKFIIPSGLTTVVDAIVLQIINAQLLILIGLMLYKITNKKIVFILYMLSFQTLLFSVFFEKYQLCVFFVVLYVYKACKNKEQDVLSLVSSVGSMPTSAVIGVTELISEDKLSVKFKNVLKTIIVCLLLVVCLGRVHIFTDGYTELTETKEQFSNMALTTKEKFISTTKVFQSSLVALSSSDNVRKGKYWWIDLNSEISILSIAILSIVIIGGITTRKSLFGKVSLIWTSFAFILFILLNWSSHETPLFALYFSWAIIPLFVYGLEYISGKLNKNINMKYVYGVIIFFMIIVNVSTLFDISKFLILK